ncbi:hypothetical protein F443_13142 [Phytophthora nicotianae P1569]|uniref:Uncharacterized protein n=1 Tax=Phytophthora nicotianae P1569 TaxID=1317065 RepID=V9EU89_PHYNI|nr:hypothetical protein F443_13142 [Phytophthora nicotianae P1569]
MSETSYRSLQLDLIPVIEVSWLAQSTLKMLAQAPHQYLQAPQVNQVVEPKLPNPANTSVRHLVYLELLRVELRLVSGMRSRSHHREVLPTITATDWLTRREPELVDVVELWPTLLSARLKIKSVLVKRVQQKTTPDSAGHTQREDTYRSTRSDKLYDKLGRLKSKCARLEKKREEEREKNKNLELSNTRLHSELIAIRGTMRGGWNESTSEFSC